MWLKRKHYKDSQIETFPGCYNTGTSPTVLHAYLAEVRGFDFYMVGASGDVKDRDIRMRAYWDYIDGKRSTKGHGDRRVYLYRTMNSARAKYRAMCKAAQIKRSTRITERNAIAQRARGGDLAAVLELGLDW